MPEKFKTAFVAHVPDADPAKHRCTITTSLYELTSILVRNDEEAIKLCQELAQKEGIRAFVLCPGFTHQAIARIVDALGEDVSVSVARGDGPSNRVAQELMRAAGWFTKEG